MAVNNIFVLWIDISYGINFHLPLWGFYKKNYKNNQNWNRTVKFSMSPVLNLIFLEDSFKSINLNLYTIYWMAVNNIFVILIDIWYGLHFYLPLWGFYKFFYKNNWNRNWTVKFTMSHIPSLIFLEDSSFYFFIFFQEEKVLTDTEEQTDRSAGRLAGRLAGRQTDWKKSLFKKKVKKKIAETSSLIIVITNNITR
jgi:hypothetical protein